MFKPTDPQMGLFPLATQLPKSAQRRLEGSWAEGFRLKVLPVLLEAEAEFADLYDDRQGRPNWSIARRLGIEVLKELRNLDDQSALDALCFDLRWQHALDLEPDNAYQSRRSQVDFRSRLVAKDPDMDRIRKLFDRIGDTALSDLGVSTAEQRVDSTHIVSNIRCGGRLALFRRVLENFGRWLQATFPEKLSRLDASLVTWLGEDRQGWFGLADKERERRKAQQLAEWLSDAKFAFDDDKEVNTEEPYQLVVRVLHEHCKTSRVELSSSTDGDADPPQNCEGDEETGGEDDNDSEEKTANLSECAVGEDVRVEVLKKPAEKGAALQSPFDPDAGYGHKGSGYSVQIAETCNNEQTEIITDYDLTPANETDKGKTVGVLDRLAATNRLPEKLYADAGYPTGNSIIDAQSRGTQLFAPVIRPRLPTDAIGREAFEFDDLTGQVRACPAGHAPIRHGKRSSINEGNPTLHAYFSGDRCRACPLLGRCVARSPNNGKKGNFHLELLPRLRARDEAYGQQQQPEWKEAYKIRSGIEATNSELKRAHGLGRLRVRRLPRVRLAVACKLIACNIKRWMRATEGQSYRSLLRLVQGLIGVLVRRTSLFWALLPSLRGNHALGLWHAQINPPSRQRTPLPHGRC